MKPSDDVLRRLYAAPPEKVLLVLIVMVTVAAIYDIRYRKIPNWLTIGGVLLGFAINFALGPPEGGVLFALLGFGAAFGIYMVMYVLRATAAADVKLMGAVGALVGWERWFGIYFATAIVGGVMAIALVTARKRFKRTIFNVGFILSEIIHGRPAYVRNEELDVRNPKAVRLPHGAVIAVGTVSFLVIAARLTH